MAKSTSTYKTQPRKATVVLAAHGLCSIHRTPILSDGDCWECEGPATAYEPKETTVNTTVARNYADTRPAKLATQKQLDLLKRLFAERTTNEEAVAARTVLLHAYKTGTLTAALASKGIDTVMALPRDAKPAPVAQGGIELEAGKVYTNDRGEHVRVVNGRNGLYGKVRVAGGWEFRPGALRGLRAITAEEAAAWGLAHESCCFCSRDLSDDGDGRSMQVGYGPICAEKYSLPWG